MYTLTRGPSKLATQRRTGPTQQAVESSKLGELRGRPQPGPWPPASPAQKLIFNRVNGKRPPLLLQQISAPEECYTLAHEENVRFVYEAPHTGNPCCKPTQCLFPLPSLAAGRAAAGRQPERGERLRPRAVRGENPQPRTQKLRSH
ncbi:MAPK regulated corepressor interacting protein 2 isoform X1 [Prinia subflava]|uniref:MAPK regulated corepressor interacting protein 2 isoform X1 n=1 Tax=Prinia subflava TaxID=208062 RepID=UPI002FE4053D